MLENMCADRRCMRLCPFRKATEMPKKKWLQCRKNRFWTAAAGVFFLQAYTCDRDSSVCTAHTPDNKKKCIYTSYIYVYLYYIYVRALILGEQDISNSDSETKKIETRKYLYTKYMWKEKKKRHQKINILVKPGTMGRNEKNKNK